MSGWWGGLCVHVCEIFYKEIRCVGMGCMCVLVCACVCLCMKHAYKISGLRLLLTFVGLPVPHKDLNDRFLWGVWRELFSTSGLRRNAFQGFSLRVRVSSKAGMIGNCKWQGHPSIFHEVIINLLSASHRFKLWEWRPASPEDNSAFQGRTQGSWPGGPASVLQCNNTPQEFAPCTKICVHTRW